MAHSTETIATPLTERLGCRYQIISAGMGGPARAELAAAVSATAEIVARMMAEAIAVIRGNAGKIGA